MVETMRKCLFLDYDECLVNSLWVPDIKTAEEYLDVYGEYWRGEDFLLPNNERYVSFLRNSTKDILTFSRQLFGNENVYLLSTGTKPYVETSAEKLDLGFQSENIFGRGELWQLNPHPDFAETYNILVDNEFYSFHRGRQGKISFLNELERENYIQVPPFSIFGAEDREDYFEWLSDKILDRFNN
jgi:hypothetical protein